MKTAYLILLVLLVIACSNRDSPSSPEDAQPEAALSPFSGMAVLPGGVQMEFVWIEPGTFTMGTTEEQELLLRENSLWHNLSANEQPAHEVIITRGFWLGKYEVTQGQWAAVMGTAPWRGRDFVQINPKCPAVYLAWAAVQDLVGRLNTLDRQRAYRLPTEAEWEYACRAGTTTPWSFGDNEEHLGRYAWHYDNAWRMGAKHALPVGTKLANSWGLFDMHGNTQEWVQDWTGSYTSEAQVDPQGPVGGFEHVRRGGRFSSNAYRTSSASRNSTWPRMPVDADFGVRLVRME